MGIADGTAAFCIVAAYGRAEPSNLSPFTAFSFLLPQLDVETPFDRLIPGIFLIVGASRGVPFYLEPFPTPAMTDPVSDGEARHDHIGTFGRAEI